MPLEVLIDAGTNTSDRFGDPRSAEKKAQERAGSCFPDRFALGVTASFFAVELFNILHHEMWRDELQAWMIARQSGSILDLVRNMRYEGHPPLWFLLLYALTRFTHWLPAMQLLNLAIATGTAYLIAAHSPFSKWQRVLLCFGYFPLYEYGAISRNYGIGLLFLCWFCAWYRPDRKQNWIIGALLLSLLANTSVYGTMIALAFAVSLFVAPALAAADSREFLALRTTHARTAALVFSGCIAVAIAQMNPPPDTGFAMGWHLTVTARSLQETLGGMWKAYVPIPSSLGHFWNTNFFSVGNGVDARWPMFGAEIILLVALLLLAGKRLALLAYASATGAILAFMHVKYMGGERHIGHLFLVFIACLWISARLPERELSSRLLERASRLMAGQGPRILTCFLCVHLAVAAIACWVDWARPFSQGKSAAAFVRSNGKAGMFMVGDADFAASTVAGYLDRGIYYPRSKGVGTFIVWNRTRLEPRRNLLDAANDMAALRKEDVLVISSYPLTVGASPAHEVAEFTGSIEPTEDFYLYVVGAR